MIILKHDKGKEYYFRGKINIECASGSFPHTFAEHTVCHETNQMNGCLDSLTEQILLRMI